MTLKQTSILRTRYFEFVKTVHSDYFQRVPVEHEVKQKARGRLLSVVWDPHHQCAEVRVLVNLCCVVIVIFLRLQKLFLYFFI